MNKTIHIKVNWALLAKSFNVTLCDLNKSWNNGAILVFDGLDSLLKFYIEAEIQCPTIALKVDIKEKHVVYTQHLFFMW